MTAAELVRQEAVKNRIWIISAMSVCLLVAISLMMFYRPQVKLDNAVFKSKEREMKALELQTIAFQKLINEQANRIESLKGRDSILIKEIITNGEAIRKIKINDTKTFDRYSSSDWAAYFRDLPEPR